METISQIIDQLSQAADHHRTAVIYLVTGGFLLVHLRKRIEWVLLLIGIGIVFTTGTLFFLLWQNPEPVPFSLVSAILFGYGVMLFVLLSEAMLRGFANILTAKRGENWTKEIDYVYLAIGSVGILASLSRIEVLTGRVIGTEVLAPLVLTTAIVIRFIKTRAEIGGWNKPSFRDWRK
jgi:hypothetical protein